MKIFSAAPFTECESVRLMELVEAAENQDWERVKVRRPLEAVSSSGECGPSRDVRLMHGQWTLKASSHAGFRPCYANL
jgi:hypothetical protein